MARDDLIESELFAAQTTGINFDKYNDIPVEASGNDVPAPVQSFEELSMHEVLKSNVKLAGYQAPTPIQKNGIPVSLGKRDLMACAQTGSGKTAAFLIPLIAALLEDPHLLDIPPSGQRGRRTFNPFALILAPTRELATQIFDESKKFCYRTGLRPVVVYGGAEVKQQLRDLDRGVDILVATPGRLVDMLDRGRMSLAHIRFLIFDEADRMLDMGFEPQIREIVEKFDMPVQSRQTSMFSATFPREIQRLAQDFLNDYVFLAVGRVGSATENVKQVLKYVDEHQKKTALIDELTKCQGLTLIFVETKRQADHIETYLTQEGLNATSIHGDRSQPEREDALANFRSGRCPVLVATSVAARGLDIPNVKHVINYDVPTNIDDYVHRIGRTGRAGHKGTAIAFVNENTKILKEIHAILKETKQEIDPQFERLVESVTGGSSYYGGGGRGRGGGGRGGSRGAERW